MSYINFNDETVPVGKRKQAYVKWAVKRGTDIMVAKRQANKKFGFEKKPGVIAIVRDMDGRMHQRSFTGDQEIFATVDLRKYERCVWIKYISEEESQKVERESKGKGWDCIHVMLNS